MLLWRCAPASGPGARFCHRFAFLGGLLLAVVGGCPAPDAGLPSGDPNTPGTTPTVVQGITVFEPGDEGGVDPLAPPSEDDAQFLRFRAEPLAPPAPGVALSIVRTDGSAAPDAEFRWLFDGPARLEATQIGASQTLILPEAGVYTVRCWLIVAGVAVSIPAESPALSPDAAEILVPPTVSGYIFDEHGAPLAKVRVAVDGSTASVTSAEDGSFTLSVASGSSGTLRPALEGYAFTPENWAFANLATSRGNLIFRAVRTGPPVQPDNDPLASAVSAATLEESATVIALSGHDPRNRPLRYVITQLPSHGTLVDLGTGLTISAGQVPYVLDGSGREVRYAPTTNYYNSGAPDTFQFRVDNGEKQSTPAAVSVSVRGVNDAPRFTVPDPPSSLRAGQTAAITMLAVSAGPSNESAQSVAFSVASSDPSILPSSKMSFSGSTLTINPISAGPVTLTITARDNGGTADGGDDTTTHNLGLSIGSSDPPSAEARTLLVHRNTPETIYLTGRDQSGYSSLEPLGQALTFSIVTPPSHGDLHGTPPNLIYVPDTNFTGADSFTFTANDGVSDSDPATITLNVQPFAPPIGTPAPSFGVSEQAAWPPAWPSAAAAGSYYIDNTHPAATDTANAYGYPDKPRKTIPWPVPLTPGAVVEIAGGPYDSAARFKITGGGAAGNPAFVRGASATARPHLRNGLDHYAGGGGYVIFENIKLTGSVALCAGYGHHVALRHCELTGKVGGGSVVAVSGDTGTASQTHNILIYNNLIRDNGDWLADFDEDAHGIGVVYYSNDVWILDNEFFHNSGNGVQVNAGQTIYELTTHHVYVGRNEAHHNKQAGIWSKVGHDIVFSQNHCYSTRPVGENPSNFGDGMGGQYRPSNLWYLFNEIHDCSNGIRLSSQGGGALAGTGENIYIIGNLIYDIHHTTTDLTGLYPVVGGSDYLPNDPWSAGRALSIWQPMGDSDDYSGGPDTGPATWIINNTIFDADAAVGVARQYNRVVMINNLFVNKNYGPLEGTGLGESPHIMIEHDSSSNLCRIDNNLFDSPARLKWGYAAAAYGFGGANGADNRTADWNSLFIDGAAPAGRHGGLRLTAGATAIDAGISAVPAAYQAFQTLYGIDIRVDFDGNPRPASGAAWDLGAYERQ